MNRKVLFVLSLDLFLWVFIFFIGLGIYSLFEKEEVGEDVVIDYKECPGQYQDGVFYI